VEIEKGCGCTERNRHALCVPIKGNPLECDYPNVASDDGDPTAMPSSGFSGSTQPWLAFLHSHLPYCLLPTKNDYNGSTH
jgi:hypothetical protein